MPETKHPKSNAAAAPVERTWSRGDFLFALLLVLAVFVAYEKVWHAGFIWDDDAHLTANPCIIGPLGFSAIWTSGAAVYYPLVLTAFWLQHALWGLNPLLYHLVNVAMHAACAILLWRLLLALKVPGARLGAALWALHPVMVESVAWITELKNTQSCFFYLLAILFFLGWRNSGASPAHRKSRAFYALALLCAALAILSKSSTVMLPVVLWLCVGWLDRRWRSPITVGIIPFLLISLGAGGWTIWEQKFHSGAVGSAWGQTWPERVVIAGRAVWFYLGKLMWPHPLIFIYPRWKIAASHPLAWLPALAVAFAMSILWRGRNGRMRPLFFAAAYFVISLFPVLGFFDVYYFRYSFVADHFQYLAAIGPLALAGAGISSVFDFRPGKTRPFRAALFAALAAALGFLTWNQSASYSDVETLWRAVISRNPECWMARNNLGNILLQQGRKEEALSQFSEAVRITPDSTDVHYNFGAALLQQGRLDDAITQLREALRLDPSHVEARNNLGNALAKQGRTEEAISEYLKALRINPAHADARYNLGNALFKLGRLDEAIVQFRESLRIVPANAKARNNLGNALLQQARVEEAISQFHEALRLDTAYADAHYNLGSALFQQGRTDDAISQYREALRIDPDHAEAHNNLGNALLGQGQTGEAISQFREALRLSPSYVDARYNLGSALLRQGDKEEAIAEYRETLRLNPDHAQAHSNLGVALFQQGRMEEAVGHLQRALELRPDDLPAKNNLAWILAAAPQAALRDGPRALELAFQASESAGGNNPLILRTLAAAYAETGDFPKALQTAQTALRLAETQSNNLLAETLRQELKLYEAGSPYRDPVPPGSP